MRTTSITTGLVLSAGLAFVSAADIPTSLDRVPLDTPLIVAIDNAAAARESVARLGHLIDGPKVEGEQGYLEPLNKLLALPGLAPEGSAAVLLYPKPTAAHHEKDAAGHGGQPAEKADAEKDGDDEFFDEGMEAVAAEGVEFLDQFDMIALVPVTGAKEFAAGLGAVLEDGRASCTVEGHQLFLRDISGGHVAMSPSKELLDGFQPGEKQLAAHTAAVGEVGGAIAKDDHVLVIMNVPLMQGKIDTMLKEVGRGAGAEMGMPGMGQMLPVGESIVEGFTRDATRMIVGAGGGDAGVWIDMGAQYKDGSEAASVMSGVGNAAALTGRLPSKPFVLAGAFDISSAGAKRLLGGALGVGGAAAGGEKDAGARAFQSPFSMIAQLPSMADGWAVLIGENPAGMQTGLLTQSVYCVQSKDPAAYLAKMEEWTTATNGLKVDGVTYKSQYTKGAEDVGGVKADLWEVQTIPDKNNPNAMMLNMTQGFLFGGPRMRGYAAGTDGAVVMTMSKNKANLTSAIAAARGKPEDGKSLGDNKDIQHAASFLPSGRAVELFISPRPIFEAASGMLEQIGSTGFEVPERVSPVAMGAAMHGGGVHMRAFVPSDVLMAVETIAKSMEDAQAELMAPMDAKDDGAPRF